jgi:hypothetical protein
MATCTDEGNLTNPHSRQPAGIGHADYAATDFLDTMPLPRDETAPPASVARESIEHAIARHESATVALSAAIGAIRDVAPPRARGSQPALANRTQPRSTARPAAPERLTPKNDAGAPVRAAGPSHRPTAVAPGTDSAGRLRGAWVVDRQGAYVASFTPSRHAAGQRSANSDWVTPSRSSPPGGRPQQRLRHAAGWTPTGRARTLSVYVAVVAVVTIGAFALSPRRHADTGRIEASKAESLPRPNATNPGRDERAATVLDESPARESAQSSTGAADAQRQAEVRTYPVSAQPQEVRRSRVSLRMEADPQAKLQSRLSGRVSAAPDAVAAAVTAAQAKADAFLRDDVQASPEPAPAESNPSGSLASSGPP